MEAQNKTQNWKGLLAGFAAGLCNGLFGAGGGMIAVAALTGICAYPPPRAHATAIALMLPLTLVSGVLYACGGMVDYRALLFVAPTLLIGGVLGAKLTGKLKDRALDTIFTALMALAGGWLLFS